MIVLVILPIIYGALYVHTARTKPYGRNSNNDPEWFQWVSVIHKWKGSTYLKTGTELKNLSKQDVALQLNLNKTGRLIWAERDIDISFKYDFDRTDDSHAYFSIDGSEDMYIAYINLYNSVNFFFCEDEFITFSRDALWSPEE